MTGRDQRWIDGVLASVRADPRRLDGEQRAAKLGLNRARSATERHGWRRLYDALEEFRRGREERG